MFRLNTRRFGALAELFIKRLHSLDKARSVFHDLYDGPLAQRVEVKFSTVQQKWSATLREDNLEAVLREAVADRKGLSFENLGASSFDCNIQQVKPAEFEVLFYGLFFSDCVLVFRCESSLVPSMPGWSDKQHKGNRGEGQFHITDKNLARHVERHLVGKKSYPELAALLFPGAGPAEASV